MCMRYRSICWYYVCEQSCTWSGNHCQIVNFNWLYVHVESLHFLFIVNIAISNWIPFIFRERWLPVCNLNEPEKQTEAPLSIFVDRCDFNFSKPFKIDPPFCLFISFKYIYAMHYIKYIEMKRITMQPNQPNSIEFCQLLITAAKSYISSHIYMIYIFFFCSLKISYFVEKYQKYTLNSWAYMKLEFFTFFFTQSSYVRVCVCVCIYSCSYSFSSSSMSSSHSKIQFFCRSFSFAFSYFLLIHISCSCRLKTAIIFRFIRWHNWDERWTQLLCSVFIFIPNCARSNHL